MVILEGTYSKTLAHKNTHIDSYEYQYFKNFDGLYRAVDMYLDTDTRIEYLAEKFAHEKEVESNKRMYVNTVKKISGGKDMGNEAAKKDLHQQKLALEEQLKKLGKFDKNGRFEVTNEIYNKKSKQIETSQDRWELIKIDENR